MNNVTVFLILTLLCFFNSEKTSKGQTKTTKITCNILTIFQEDNILKEAPGTYLLDFDNPKSGDITITDTDDNIFIYYLQGEMEKIYSEDGLTFTYVGAFRGDDEMNWIITYNPTSKMLFLNRKEIKFSLLYGNGLPTFDNKETEKNDLRKMNLYGKVKSIREITYEAKDYFGDTVKGRIKLLTSGESENNRSFSFNRDGYIIVESSFTERYDGRGEILETKITTKYNENNQKIDEQHYNYLIIRREQWMYEYSTNGVLLELNKYDTYGNLRSKIKYEYDETGNNIKINDYNSSGELCKEITYTYNSKQYIAEEIMNRYCNMFEGMTFPSEGYSRFSYEYDNYGNIIKTISKNEFGEVIETILSKYNIYGNVVEEVFLGEKALPKKSVKYKYDNFGNVIKVKVYPIYSINRPNDEKLRYDKHNNWIRKIHFERDGFFMDNYIIEREIEYY